LEDTEFENDTVDAGEIGASQTITALYQVVPRGRTSGSFGELEFRYKIPGQDQSRLLVHSLNNNRDDFAASSENMRFAASLAGFGMLLKNSDYRGEVSFDLVKQWASNSRSYDPFGFREEYIQLIDRVKSLE
jgi:Ca-activated chloride channel family protein